MMAIISPQSFISGNGEEGLGRDSSCPVLCEHYDMYDLAKNTRSANAAMLTYFYLMLLCVHYKLVSNETPCHSSGIHVGTVNLAVGMHVKKGQKGASS